MIESASAGDKPKTKTQLKKEARRRRAWRFNSGMAGGFSGGMGGLMLGKEVPGGLYTKTAGMLVGGALGSLGGAVAGERVGRAVAKRLVPESGGGLAEGLSKRALIAGGAGLLGGGTALAMTRSAASGAKGKKERNRRTRGAAAGVLLGMLGGGGLGAAAGRTTAGKALLGLGGSLAGGYLGSQAGARAVARKRLGESNLTLNRKDSEEILRRGRRAGWIGAGIGAGIGGAAGAAFSPKGQRLITAVPSALFGALTAAPTGIEYGRSKAIRDIKKKRGIKRVTSLTFKESDKTISAKRAAAEKPTRKRSAIQLAKDNGISVEQAAQLLAGLALEGLRRQADAKRQLQEGGSAVRQAMVATKQAAGKAIGNPFVVGTGTVLAADEVRERRKEHRRRKRIGRHAKTRERKGGRFTVKVREALQEATTKHKKKQSFAQRHPIISGYGLSLATAVPTGMYLSRKLRPVMDRLGSGVKGMTARQGMKVTKAARELYPATKGCRRASLPWEEAGRLPQRK